MKDNKKIYNYKSEVRTIMISNTVKMSRGFPCLSFFILCLFVISFSLSLIDPAEAANSTTAGIVSAWASGTTSIKVKMPYTGDDNANNTYTIKWKLCTDASYPPGNIINGNHTSSPYIAEITGLTANTCYNIEATYNDIDGVTGSNPQTIKIYSTWDSTLLHNRNRFPTSTKWDPTGWGVPGGQYGQFDCGTCHEPRATNIKGIKSTIVAPSGNFPGSTVIFQSTTSPNGFGDDSGGHTTSTKICEICHSITNYHRYNTTGQTNLTHNNNTDCTQCHPHAIGFAPAGGACDSCHGNPPTTATLGGPTGLATPATGATNPLSPGAHAVHVQTRGMTCDACHRGTAMPASEKKIDMGFSISGTTYPGFQNTVESGTFTGYNALSNGYTWNASWPGTTVNTAPNYDNRCSNIYCHGSTLTAGSNTSPSWVGGAGEAGCGTCHGASASTPPTAGSHTRHASSASGNLGLACTKCHASVTDGSHVNGSVAWDLDDTDSRIGASATYRGSNAGQTGQLAPSATYGTCTNIYCHSNVQTSPPGGALTYGTPTWGGTVTCSTTSCHGGDTDPNKIMTGSHTKHVQTTGYNYSCSLCHNGAGSGTTKHSDYSIDVSFSGIAGAGTYSGNPAPGDAYGNCSSVYCHGSTTPTWGGAALTCDGCHYGNSTLAGKHSVHYATTTVATSTSFTPSNNSTTTAYIYSCGVCHNATQHAQGPVSANQAAQVSFDTTVAGGGTYTAGSLVGADRGFNWTAGTCSSTYCHSNGAGGAPNNTTFNWNSAAGALTCAGCHNYTKASGTPMATGSHTAHINNTDAALGTFNCYQCHYATTTNDTAITDKTKHINKLKDVAFYTTLNPSGTWTSPNCSNLYCHSTGKTLTDVPAGNLPPVYGGSHYTTMSWGGAGIGCNGCHGRSVTAGAPDYTSTGAGAAGANSHMAHTGSGTDSGSCDTCHTNTTNTGTSIKAGSTLHINKTRDVTFNTTKAGASATYTAGTKTCSNLACHGPSQWGGPSQDCVSCHSAVLGDRRQVTGTGGDFVRASRHVSNGTTTQIVTAWDCVVCHLEGDESYTTTRARVRSVSSPTAMGHTGIPGSKADVNLRNVDMYTTGWIWNRFDVLTGNGPRGTLTQAQKTQMRNDMDRFCLSCHDSDTSANPATLHDLGTSFVGLTLQKVASGGGSASIKARSTGLLVGTAAVGTNRLKPFNEADNGKNAHETYTSLITQRSNRFSTNGPVDVRGQFNYTGAVGSAWASHHNLNIFTKRYSTRSTAIFPNSVWTTYVTKEGTSIQTAGETAGLHCSDCHLNEVNAHGSANSRYMLASGFTDADSAWSGSAISGTQNPIPCYRCHAYAAYNQASTGIGRFDHSRDSNRTLTTITSPFGIICFNCHGGFSANPYNQSFGAIHGTNESYTPGIVTYTTPVGQTKRYRFMSGSVMRGYKPGEGTGTFTEPTSWTSSTGTNAGCYTVASNDTWSSGCSSHAAGVAGGSGSLNYPKPLEY